MIGTLFYAFEMCIIINYPMTKVVLEYMEGPRETVKTVCRASSCPEGVLREGLAC